MQAACDPAVARYADFGVTGTNAQVAFELQGSVNAFIAWQRASPLPLIGVVLAGAGQIALRRGCNPPPAGC